MRTDRPPPDLPRADLHRHTVSAVHTGRRRMPFRRELETRVVVPVALLQELLPLIRRARGGRILWITTPALVAIPYAASIHAGEFALQCIARSR